MFLAFLGAAMLAGQVPPPVSAAVVARMLDRYGAKGTVDRLANAKPKGVRTGLGEFDKVLDGIAGGDSRWLALVPRLAPGTDAGAAESLRIAVAQALPRNPVAVLRLIARDPSWSDACSFPMIEPTRSETRRYFIAAIPAVNGVLEPELRAVKRSCRSELLKARHGR